MSDRDKELTEFQIELCNIISDKIMTHPIITDGSKIGETFQFLASFCIMNALNKIKENDKVFRNVLVLMNNIFGEAVVMSEHCSIQEKKDINH